MTRKLQSKLLVALISAFLLASVACANGSDTSDPSAVAPTGLQEVTIAQYGHVFIYLPLYVADKAGHFEREGLKVSFVDTGGDDKTFASLLSGSASFGVADPVFAAISAERGQEGRVIGQVVGKVSFWGIADKATVPNIKAPSDLKGLTVATYPSPSTNYALLQEYLSRSGSDIKQSVQVRESAFGTLLALLKSGQADVIMELEPTTSVAVAGGGRVVFSYAREYGDFAFTGLTTLPEIIQRDPRLVQRVVSALNAALRDIHSDPRLAKRVAKQEFPDLDDAIVSAAVDRLLAEGVIPKTAEIPDAAWTAAVQVRRKVGDLASDPPGRIVDNSFARASSVSARTSE